MRQKVSPWPHPARWRRSNRVVDDSRETVARILNDRGYRTRRGSPFSDTTLANLLNDPIVKGLHRANYTQTDVQENAKREHMPSPVVSSRGSR